VIPSAIFSPEYSSDLLDLAVGTQPPHQTGDLARVLVSDASSQILQVLPTGLGKQAVALGLKLKHLRVVPRLSAVAALLWRLV
jgi:hypothetical protein